MTCSTAGCSCSTVAGIRSQDFGISASCAVSASGASFVPLLIKEFCSSCDRLKRNFLRVPHTQIHSCQFVSKSSSVPGRLTSSASHSTESPYIAVGDFDWRHYPVSGEFRHGRPRGFQEQAICPEAIFFVPSDEIRAAQYSGYDSVFGVTFLLLKSYSSDLNHWRILKKSNFRCFCTLQNGDQEGCP